MFISSIQELSLAFFILIFNLSSALSECSLNCFSFVIRNTVNFGNHRQSSVIADSPRKGSGIIFNFLGNHQWPKMSINTMATTNNSASNTTYLPTSAGSLPTEPNLLGTPVSYISASLVCLLIICALIANIFVCLAVYKQHSARRITRFFIVNLCIADIFITVISMPVWLIFMLYARTSAIYLLGETFVSIWTHLDILCGTASILSLTSISVDRYIAVSRPYAYIDFMTTKRALQVIGGIWLYSLTVALLRKPLREYKEEGRRILNELDPCFLITEQAW